MPEGARSNYIKSRVNLPTGKSSREISLDIDPRIRAQAFFSARVSQAHILDRFREVTDDYLNGKISRGEARNLMQQYAIRNGLDDGTLGMKNLASTGRLNMILDQNAKMAGAVGDYERMHTEANLRVFPYLIFRASVGSKQPRAEHQKMDGMIRSKDDPYVEAHWPPLDFGCNCRWENCSRKKAERDPIGPRKPISREQADKEFSEKAKGGFAFNPRHAFEEFDLSGVKTPEVRGAIREEAEIEFGSQVSFSGAPDQPEFKAVVTPKKFHTFEEEKLEPSSSWKEKDLPAPPGTVEAAKARQDLSTGFEVAAPDGEKVVFDQECLAHWEIEEAKSEKEIDARLTQIPMAIDTVMNPLEIWDQGTQRGFIKAFRKLTGGFSGCLVFVLKNGKVRTYFLKSLSALDKARKGFSVRR